MSNESVFSGFTNLYSLSKTLKFELKPTEMTKAHLNFDKDKLRAEHYKNIKVLFDQLHRQFIDQGLQLYAESNSNYNEFFRVYKEFLTARKNNKKIDGKFDTNKKTQFENVQKEFEAIKLLLRKRIVESFNLCGENFKFEINSKLIENDPIKYKKDAKGKISKGLNDSGIEVLTEAGILEVLKLLVSEEELTIKDKTKEEIIKGIEFFDGFFTYFGPFNTTRENLYKSDGTATAIATRVIDENLVRFCDNIITVNTEIKLKDDHKVAPTTLDIEYNKNIFNLNSFNDFVTQGGISLYNGGAKGDQNLGQFNTSFSKYIQDNFHQNKKLVTKNLYKIMLSEKVSPFVEETQESCIEIMKTVDQLQNEYLEKIQVNYQMIWDNQNNEDFLSKVFIKKENLASFSSQFFGSWYILEKAIAFVGAGNIKIEKGDQKVKLEPFITLSSIKLALEALASGVDFDIKTKTKSKSKSKKQNQNLDNLFETKTVELKGYEAGEIFKDSLISKNQKSSRELWDIFLQVWQKDFEKQIEENQKYSKVASEYLLKLDKYTALEETKFELEVEEKGEKKMIAQTQSNLAKLWLDSCMNIWQGIKMFEITKKNKNKYSDYTIDETFYELVIPFVDDYQLSKLYDKIRNFSTKKAFSTNKFKINFENASLLAGWDLNKEADNTSVIIKNGNNYELIIIDKKSNKFFNKDKNPELYQGGDILKMEYKLLTEVSKSIPKCSTQIKDVISHFKNSDNNFTLFKKDKFSKELIITKEEFELNNKIYQKSNIGISYIRDKDGDVDEKQFVKVFQKGFVDAGGNIDLYKTGLIKWINFCKRFLDSYTSCNYFDFSNLKDAKEYNSLDEFYKDVDLKCYKLKWVSVNSEVINKAEIEGKIFRFQIKNKDWNPESKGKKNLQTIFWNELFSPENLSNPCYKLNGKAEIFQRPKTELLKKERIVTKKNKILLHGGAINKKRFTENKTFLHIPITINFGAKEITKFNDYLTENLDPKKLNYLGIDRGENHLLYYCIVNTNGEIVVKDGKSSMGSLNSIDGSPDYEILLNERADKKKNAPDKWAAIGNIKELKAGYLSLAVGKIIRLAIENNALIVLENLNYGFKKSRTIKFEKSVYQKFEVALATKLQHVVLKERKSTELGGALLGLQLCPKLEKIDQLEGKEWGIIKYVEASYTSRIDPLTGWHKTKYFKTVEEIKKTFNPDENNYIKIGWDTITKCYTFDDGYGKGLIYARKDLVRNYYDPKEKDFALRTKIITGQEIHDKLDEILGKFKNNGEFNQVEMWANLNDGQWKSLAYRFDLICNIRVKQKSEDREKIDRIQSPVLCTPNNCIFPNSKKDFNPVFFDTENIEELQQQLNLILPRDGDANGAYNIAKRDLELVTE